MITSKKVPTLVDRFADNGEFSHQELIDSNTGKVLWSDDNNNYTREEIVNFGSYCREICDELPEIETEELLDAWFKVNRYLSLPIEDNNILAGIKSIKTYTPPEPQTKISDEIHNFLISEGFHENISLSTELGGIRYFKSVNNYNIIFKDSKSGFLNLYINNHSHVSIYNMWTIDSEKDFVEKYNLMVDKLMKLIC